MASACAGKTVRRWNLQLGEEIVEARVVRDQEVTAVAVSRDGRWVIIAGGDRYKAGHDPVNAEVKSCEVETGITRSFENHSRMITCVDISANSKLLASGSVDGTARIWNLDTGKLVAGPLLECVDMVGAVRFSYNSKRETKCRWPNEICAGVLDNNRCNYHRRI
jgi:WD40 repeat protein